MEQGAKVLSCFVKKIDGELLPTSLDDLTEFMKARDVKISGRALCSVSVDIRKVSGKLGIQMVGRFIELVSTVM